MAVTVGLVGNAIGVLEATINIGLAGAAIGVYVPQTIEKAVAEAIGVKEISLRTRHIFDGEDIVTHILSSIWKDTEKKETTWETTKKIQKDE